MAASNLNENGSATSSGVDYMQQLKDLQKQTDKNTLNQYSLGYANGVCPHCGYCPHCGRGGYHTYPYYPWYQPYYPWGGTQIWCHTTTQGQ